MSAHSLQIRTPEGIVFAQTLAGPVLRFLAWFLDLLCILAIVWGVQTLLVGLAVLAPGIATAVMTAVFFAVSIGYAMTCEWLWRGQTVGKRLFRLRVMDAEGLRLTFSQVAIRNLLRFVDALPLAYLVGGLACWFSRRHQRLGDLAANTIVVRLPRLAEPDLDQLLAGKYNSLRQHPHLVARLRQQVEPAEAALALQALLRRGDFEPVAGVELFAQLAAHFRAKAAFPGDALAGITDEQFVRNVVDVVFRAGPGEGRAPTEGGKSAGNAGRA